mgnify:CR=1 FL=1
MYIAIAGNIGSGKTSLTEILANRTGARAYYEDSDNPYIGDFYDDMKNNTIPHIGEVKSKSFLFDENRNKSKMHLIKGDKVLILSSKIDENNQEWYRIFYSGKKDIDMWIKADAVDLN